MAQRRISPPLHVTDEPMDPRNPSVLDAREYPTDFIVYYSQSGKPEWHLERVADGAILHRGSLEEMLDLLPRYPNSRRASWAEDMLRWKPSIFREDCSAVFEKLDALGRPKDE